MPGVVRVAEVRAVRRERGADRGPRSAGRSVGRGSAQPPSHRVAVRPPGDTRARTGRAAAARPPCAGARRPHLLAPRDRGHRRVERAAGEGAACADQAPHLDRHALGQLLNGEVGAEVVRDRVEPQPCTRRAPVSWARRLVAQVRRVDELRLAGEVDVVGARLGAGSNQRLAVEHVRPDGRDDDTGGLGHGPDRLGVRRRRRAAAASWRGAARSSQLRADALQLGLVAPGQRPAAAGGGVAGEVLGGQLAGEAGGPEDDDVVVASSHGPHSIPAPDPCPVERYRPAAARPCSKNATIAAGSGTGRAGAPRRTGVPEVRRSCDVHGPTYA